MVPNKSAETAVNGTRIKEMTSLLSLMLLIIMNMIILVSKIWLLLLIAAPESDSACGLLTS